MKLEFSQQIFG